MLNTRPAHFLSPSFRADRAVRNASVAAHTQEITTDTLVDYVKRFAVSNYDTAGWDILVECCSDEEIRTALGNTRTYRGATRICWKKLVRNHFYARREAQAEAF